MDNVIYYLGTGLVAGVLAGMLGIGGGIVVVPLLAVIFTAQRFPAEVVMHLAVGTSLTAIIFTSLSSAWAHHRERAVDWARVRRLALPLAIGAVVGAAAARLWTAEQLLMALGFVEILMAIQIVFNLHPASAPPAALRWLKYPLAAGIAAISALVGTGGGLFMVPLLLWDGQSMRNAVATSSACGIPIATAGALGFAVLGEAHETVVNGVVGYVHILALLCVASLSVVGAQLGAHLAHKMPVLWLQRVFAVVLLLLGIKIVLRSF